MASGSSTNTIVDIADQTNKLILRLQESSENNKMKKPKSVSTRSFSTFLKFFDNKAEEITDTVHRTKADNTTTEQNIRKLDKMFDEMQNKLDEQRNEAKEAMKDMTELEQNELLSFFGAFTKFFSDLFVWLKDLVLSVINLIKQGISIAGNVLKSCFEDIFKYIQNMFS